MSTGPDRTAPCRSCKARIWWVRTINGKAMPLDPEPREDGNVKVGSGGIAIVLGPLECLGEDGPLYVSHFATCPTAQEHRT